MPALAEGATEADLEALNLALEGLRATRVGPVTVDLADVRLVRALLGGVALSGEALGQVHAALAAKDASALARLTRDFPAASRQGLAALLDAYGDISVLDTVRPHLPDTEPVYRALREALGAAGFVTTPRGLRLRGA